MVGTIPIVLSSSINDLYKDLPVIIVSNWESVTKEFLEKKYIEIHKSTYNFEKIYTDYWINKINNT